MSATLPVMVVLLLATGRMPPVAKVVNGLALATMLILIVLIRRTRHTRASYLWYQSAYILSFQIATIALALARVRGFPWVGHLNSQIDSR